MEQIYRIGIDHGYGNIKTKKRKHNTEALQTDRRNSKTLAERSKAENMNESEYIRYLILNQSENPRSRELELEIMRLRNEINKIGVNINQIVKNNNSHRYDESDKMKLKSKVNKVADLMEQTLGKFISHI